MRNGNKLNAVAFGVNEFGFGLIFSASFWLQMIDGIYFTSIVNSVFLAGAVLITVWQSFNRHKADAYLTAFAIRMFYLSSVFMLCHLSVYFETESEDLKFLWLIITIVLYIIGTLLHYRLEKKYWQKTLADWEDIDKMNVAKRYFRIYGSYHSHPPTPENYKKIFIIIPVGTIALTVITGILGNNFKMAFLHLGMLGLGYFCIFVFGRILAWITEIRKLQKELGVTFVTEYGMAEEKGKQRRQR